MVNNKDSSYSKTKKSTFCGHFMPSFDIDIVSSAGNLARVNKDCLLCVAFSEDQKQKLTEKLSKGKKSVKETSLQKEKDKIDDSILDDENSSIGLSSHSIVTGLSSGSNCQALAAILSQLTTLSNRIAAIESIRISLERLTSWFPRKLYQG